MEQFPRRVEARRARRKCIDLFAGAGGLAEGFRQAGFAILSGSDADPQAGETFQRNFPEATFFLGDISELSGADLLVDANLKPGELDVLIGGPPCQAFSYNNHQRSMQNVRAGLFREYLRIVGALQPKCLVMENVPGILTIGDGAVVEEIEQALSALGYDCDTRILYAEDFGIPQERRRVFFIATSAGWEDSLFPDGDHGPVPKPASNPYVHRWERKLGRSYGRVPNVWAALGDLPPLENGGGIDSPVRYAAGPRSKLQKLLRSGKRKVTNHTTRELSDVMLDRISCVPAGGDWRDIPRELLPAGMRRAKRSCHTKRYGRLSKKGRCCTILTKADPHWGSYIHPVDHRAISVREAARLQSFPDRFHFCGTRSSQYVQIGNAVPPLMAKAVGASVLKHLSRATRRAHRSARAA